MQPILNRRFWQLALILSAVLPLFIFHGCRQQVPAPGKMAGADTAAVARRTPAKPPRPWVILHAYAPDGLELRKRASIQGDTVWEGRPISVGWLVEPIVIAASGVGVANAVATTQFLIDRYDPVGIIFTGVSTPINPAHQIGDLVIPDRWINYDFGYWGKGGFLVDSVPVGRTDSAGFQPHFDFPVDTAVARLLGSAADATAFILRTIDRRLPEIHKGGVGVSGNAFIDSKSKREQLRKQLLAEIADTESAAVVQTALAAGIPIAVLRSCAAPAGESASPANQRALESFFRDSGRNTALVVSRFLENLPEGFLRQGGR